MYLVSDVLAQALALVQGDPSSQLHAQHPCSAEILNHCRHPEERVICQQLPGAEGGRGRIWLQAPVAQLKDSSSSEKSSMNSLCLAFPPALLLPLCALSDGQYLAGLTFIQTFYSLIHSTNISVGPTLCLPLSWLLETQLPLPDQKYLRDIQLPHDEFNVLSSMNIIFFINLLIHLLKKSLIYKSSSLQ